MKTWLWIKRMSLALGIALAVIIVSSVAIYFVSGYAGEGAERVTRAPDIPVRPDLLQEDLAFLFETLEAVHPDLYASLDEAASQTQREQVATQLTEPLTPAGFFQVVAPLVANLEDGHTSVSVPGAGFRAFRDDGGEAFPFSVAYHEGKGLAIRKSYAEAAGITAGDVLLRINGHDADSLYQAFRRYFSGKRLVFRNRRTDRQFRGLLWMHGIAPPYDIQYAKASSGDVLRTQVAGLSRSEIVRQDSVRGQATTAQARYTYTMLPEHIGYLDFRSMQDRAAFAEFLDDTFSQIQEEAPHGLIIDLRSNSGGNSQLGNQLLRYVNDQPYIMSGGKAWRMSTQYKQRLRGRVPEWLRWISVPPAMWVVRLAFDDARIMAVDDGEVVTLSGSPIPPGSEPLRYDGKVCFLIGPWTFSSAMMLANAVEDNDLAMLIGSETGGIPNHFGELYSFQLPHSGLDVYVSSAQFIRADGDRDNTNGVLPDIAVEQTQADTDAGIDTVLEAAKAWVLE